jgi:hypothetical protein
LSNATGAVHPALVAYPKRAEFGAVVHKTKLYDHGAPTRRVRDLFAAQVDRVVWKYKLAPETIQLGGRPDVPEIQVFSIQLKAREVSEEVLRCVDRAVRFPVIFELQAEGQLKVTAAHKRPSGTGSGDWVMSSYFASPWLPSDGPRANMPVTVHLGGLYEALLGALLPLGRRAGESFATLVERTEMARAKRSEVQRMEARLEKERQFNRKVELNSTLKRLNDELEALIR